MGTHPIFESDFDCLTDTYSAKMTKGTTSRGTRNDKTHILCRITGRRTYHIKKTNCPRNWSMPSLEGCQPTISQRIQRRPSCQEFPSPFSLVFSLFFLLSSLFALCLGSLC